MNDFLKIPSLEKEELAHLISLTDDDTELYKYADGIRSKDSCFCNSLKSL